MKKLIRVTGAKCPICTLNGGLANGPVVEDFTNHSKQSGPVIIGGMSGRVTWITKEFYCVICGILFKPTSQNGLKDFDCKKVGYIMDNYDYKFKIIRDLYYWDILLNDQKLSDSKLAPKIGISSGGLTIVHKDNSRQNEELMHSILGKPKSEENFLIIKPTKIPVLLCKTDIEHSMRAIDINNPLAKKKIKKVVVPKGAVPATLVKIFNNDLNIIQYWVPSDALKPYSEK